MPARTVVDGFRQVVAARPSAVAISSAQGAMTYGELDRLSDKTAMALIERGVGPGHRVGLYFEREPRVLVALLGILKSGAGAVPLLSSFPAERLGEIVDAAGVTLAIGPSAPSVPPGLRLTPVGLDTSELHPRECALPRLEPDSLATILFTSGTTGSAKGVPQSHGLMLRKIQRNGRVLRLRHTDRVTAFSTPAMSQGLQPVFLTLLAGAATCPFDIRKDGIGRLTTWMDGQQVTVWYSSATLLRTLARTVGATPAFPGVRLVRLGGERILPTDIEAARGLFPSAQIVLAYATTETGSICMHQVGDGDTPADGIVPIGTPLEGVTVRIVDEGGEELPAGEEGEIVVQSPDISPGYWRAPELTAARFADVPGQPGERLYRTGDVGRRRPDGLLEHLGRKDLRVKIRGFRIEIENVETALTQQPEIIRAAVAAKPGIEGDLRLVAYVQLAPGAETTVEALRVELGRRLADYMIPSTFMFVDEIPLTDSGKIARQRLPDPPRERPVLGAEYQGPRNPREEAIAGIWREVLGLTRVGIHDAFFSVGGDSLKAMLVASRLGVRLGLRVPLATLFEASTIAELSAAIERLESDGASA